MAVAILIACLALAAYVYHANNALKAVPSEIRQLSQSWTREQILEASKSARTAEEVSRPKLPPKQNRRYIIVGGSGLVGGWIVQHLLWRGESPTAVRILDLASPVRPEARDIAFIRTDITDPGSVNVAFEAPWPKDVRRLPLTVFHCAAALGPQYRYYPEFMDRYWRVNVDGTSHVLKAAKASGADCFVATSSGSVAIKEKGYFAVPWSRTQRNFTQILPNAEPESLNAPLESFNSCYAATKARTECLVHDANDATFRAGCIRPAHAIYGQGAGTFRLNSMTSESLSRQGGATWLFPYRWQFVHALNVSLGHLALEKGLLVNPNIGGRSFVITEDDLIAYDDYRKALTTLAETPMKYRSVPPLLIVGMAYLIEAYVLLQARFMPFLPTVSGDLNLMQPGTLAMCTGHFFYSIDRARDDLGYEPAMSTLEGMCLTVRDWNENAGTGR